MSYVRKPGTFWRALVAYVFMNAVLTGTAVGMITLAPFMLTEQLAQFCAAILLGCIELCIWFGTIQDPLQGWIKGEYWKDDKK